MPRIVFTVAMGIFMFFSIGNAISMSSKPMNKLTPRQYFIKQDFLPYLSPPYWAFIEGQLGPPEIPEFKDDETFSDYTHVVDGKIRVIVPKGYEQLGYKHLQDLKYCFPLASKFLNMKSIWDGIILKIYIKNPNDTAGGYYANGVIYYAKTQQNIDDDLLGVLNNDPEGFLYASSPTYCADTHEFSHYMVDRTPVRGWSSEGIAEYSQKINQPGSKLGTKCMQNGFESPDYWGDDEIKLFPYSDLSKPYGDSPGDGPKYYISAMCFWELLVNAFGDNARKQVLAKAAELRIHNKFEPWPDKITTPVFIQNVLFKTIHDHTALTTLLGKFGFKNYGDKFDPDELGNLDCNGYCWLSRNTRGECNTMEDGELVGDKYCTSSDQCTCLPSSCEGDDDCSGAHFVCKENKCIIPDCNYACIDYYGYEYGVCGSPSGIAVGVKYCDQSTTQCKCFK